MTVGCTAPIVVLDQVPNSAFGTLPSCPRRAKASWGGIHGIRSSVHSAALRGNRVRRPLTHTSSDGHQKLPNHNGLSEIAHREEDRHLCTKCGFRCAALIYGAVFVAGPIYLTSDHLILGDGLLFLLTH